MRLILGLGNPGEEYRDTRHNVGFRVVEELARRWQVPVDRLECNALTGRAAVTAIGAVGADSAAGEGEGLVSGPTEILLAKPQTYMNRSGYAARCFAERYELAPESLLVVYDEINLPLGKLRVRRAGSPAGHRGLESIIENLRSAEVPRLRLGIAGEERVEGEHLADFVLGAFAADQREAVEEMIRRAADACEVWARDGVEAAMRGFNG
jgi:PTH1 family peptidyl-tRNA hydrolase